MPRNNLASTFGPDDDETEVLFFQQIRNPSILHGDKILGVKAVKKSLTSSKPFNLRVNQPTNQQYDQVDAHFDPHVSEQADGFRFRSNGRMQRWVNLRRAVSGSKDERINVCDVVVFVDFMKGLSHEITDDTIDGWDAFAPMSDRRLPLPHPR